MNDTLLSEKNEDFSQLIESPMPSFDKSKYSKVKKKLVESFEAKLNDLESNNKDEDYKQLNLSKISIKKWVIKKNEYDVLDLPVWEVYSKRLDESYVQS